MKQPPNSIDVQNVVILGEEEARKMLFDIEKDIEIERKYFKKGKNDIAILVKISWSKHDFIDKQIIEKESRTVQIDIT